MNFKRAVCILAIIYIIAAILLLKLVSLRAEEKQELRIDTREILTGKEA